MKHVKLFEEFSINEAESKAEKAIKDALYDFDDINNRFRYKYFDVIQVKNEIFIDWITQEDYNNDGESLMIEHLKHLAKQYNVKIFLHYTVRDNDSGSNRNRKTKKGYTEIFEQFVNDGEKINESTYTKQDKYKKGDEVAYQMVFRGGVGKDGMSKGDIKIGKISSRKKNGIFGYEYWIGSTPVKGGEILGLTGRRLNEANQESSLNEAKSPARSHKQYKKLLKFFKDDYLDEIRDMARAAREYHTEYDLDMLYTDWETNPEAPQPLDFRKLKSNKDWNEKGKAYILDMLDKMGKQAADAWFDDFEHWLK